MNEEQPPTEAALRESQARFETLLESASVGIILSDATGRIELVNAKAEEIFGYQRDTLIGQSIERLIPKRLHSIHKAYRAAYLHAPQVRAMGHGRDLLARRADGSEFPVEIGLSFIRTQEGIVVMSFITDISARKEGEEALRRYARRLETMREIDRVILAADVPEEIAQVGVGHLQQLLPALHASVMLFDFDAQVALVLAAQGEARAAPRAGELLPLTSLWDLKRLQEGAPLREEGPGWVQGAQSILKVPLRVEERLIGLLYLAQEASGGFSPQQVEVAHEVATHLAVALQQAQLRAALERHALELEQRVEERTRELQRRHEVAQGLGEILAILNSNRSLEETLDYIVALAGRLLGTDASAIYYIPTPDAPLTIGAARGLPHRYVQEVQQVGGQEVVRQAVRERRPIAINDLRHFVQQGEGDQEGATQGTLLQELADHYGALLAVPLLARESVYGSVVLYYTKSHSFSAEEIALAMAFGDQAALAIENARLQTQVEASAVAAERNRLARDLHDAVTQTLFSTSLIAEVLPRLWQRDPEEGVRRLDELRQLTRGALAEMRTLLYELRPAVLVQSDLADLLRQLAEATIGRARLPVEVTVRGEGQLPPDVQVAFYRIAQEALNNLAKHSQANQATLTLTLGEGVGHLIVQDDGQGFDVEAMSAQGLGLGIMQERAHAIQGWLQIESESGVGSMVQLRWPAPQKENHNG